MIWLLNSVFESGLDLDVVESQIIGFFSGYPMTLRRVVIKDDTVKRLALGAIAK